jgi:hypothetical protein
MPYGPTKMEATGIIQYNTIASCNKILDQSYQLVEQFYSSTLQVFQTEQGRMVKSGGG